MVYYANKGDIYMNFTIEKIDFILKSIGKLSRQFIPYSSIYLHTTENIKGYLSHLDLMDKDVLTVAGSGDQLLNAYLMGARNVTCFDINPLTFLHVRLKKAAVCTLSYPEYCDFFFRSSNLIRKHDFFDKKLFDKIATNLDKDTISVFEYLYSNYERDHIYYSIYRYAFEPILGNIERMNTYLEPDNYAKLSNILKNKSIAFLESNVTELINKLGNGRFDIILLSNINDNIEKIYGKNALKNYKSLILSLSKHHLKQEGIIQVGYIYNAYFVEQVPIFSKTEEREKVFTTDEFTSMDIESFRSHSTVDKVIFYQKRKKAS